MTKITKNGIVNYDFVFLSFSCVNLMNQLDHVAMPNVSSSHLINLSRYTHSNII